MVFVSEIGLCAKVSPSLKSLGMLIRSLLMTVQFGIRDNQSWNYLKCNVIRSSNIALSVVTDDVSASTRPNSVNECF